MATNEYFEWMYDLVCSNTRYSYRKLLTYLSNVEFRFVIPMDENRAYDGINLRDRFLFEKGRRFQRDIPDGPCSVFEMMVALSMRCAEQIIDNPEDDDQIGRLFWYMIQNLGLAYMDDSRFELDIVEDTVQRFLDRDYEPNGKGGLFTVENTGYDLRQVEIWYQMCWYLDNIL